VSQQTLVEIVLAMCLVVTIGVLIILILKVWEKAFDIILQMFNMKKEFIDFVRNKYHKQTVVKPKVQ
jgi:hypothetical protein